MQQEREQRRDIGRSEQKTDENRQWASIKDSGSKGEVELSKVKITNGKWSIIVPEKIPQEFLTQVLSAVNRLC